MNDKENRLTITEFGFELSKRHPGIQLDSDMVEKTCNLPTSCPCGSKFDIHHSMSYKKGGFICIRHNDLRDQTANMISEVCNYTEIETKLTPLSGAELQDRTSMEGRKG